MEKLKPYAFLFLGSLLYSLAFPNIFHFYFPIGGILGTAILFYYILKPSSCLKKKVLYYLFYNICITALSFYWIAATLQEFGNLPLPIAALANALYALIFNPQIWIFIIGVSILQKKRPQLTLLGPLQTIILSFVLTTLEYWIPQQFPVMLGQPWIIFTENLGLAPYFGIPAFSFFSYLASFLLIIYFEQKKIYKWQLSAICLFLLFNLFVPLPKHVLTTNNLKVRLVQANISNFLKVDSESGRTASVQEVLTRYKSLSLSPFLKKPDTKPQFIVWPETAYPYPIYTNREDLTDSMLPMLMYEITSIQKAYFFFGGYDHFQTNSDGSQFQSEQNTGFLITPQGQINETYHKHILIPFGETLPFGPLTKYFSRFFPDMAFFKEGERFPLFKINDKATYISTICYEALRPEFLREYLNSISSSPHFMVNLTNDSWYGNTVEPEQHLFLTRWRSLEFNLPILRSTNTGISTIINEKGAEVKRLTYGETGNLDHNLPLVDSSQKEQTFYQKYGFWGNIPIWFLIFLFQILLLKLPYERKNE